MMMIIKLLCESLRTSSLWGGSIIHEATSLAQGIAEQNLLHSAVSYHVLPVCEHEYVRFICPNMHRLVLVGIWYLGTVAARS